MCANKFLQVMYRVKWMPYVEAMSVYPYQWRTQEYFLWGVQQIQLRTEDREDGDMGVVAP